MDFLSIASIEQGRWERDDNHERVKMKKRKIQALEK